MPYLRNLQVRCSLMKTVFMDYKRGCGFYLCSLFQLKLLDILIWCDVQVDSQERENSAKCIQLSAFPCTLYWRHFVLELTPSYMPPEIAGGDEAAFQSGLGRAISGNASPARQTQAPLMYMCVYVCVCVCVCVSVSWHREASQRGYPCRLQSITMSSTCSFISLAV